MRYIGFTTTDQPRFVEEGFAEWIATRLEPHSLAFPYYGFPVHLVAGHWLIREEASPLRVLLGRHRDLNHRCLAQAYSLRGAFFHYLHDTYGKEAVFRLAYAEEEMTPALFAQVFGQDFDTLAGEWREATLARWATTADAAQQARAYRQQTPAKHIYVCQAGKDY